MIRVLFYGDRLENGTREWLYISAIGEITVYSTFEKAQADLA